MCGIAGFIDPRGQLSDARATLEAMSSRLAHRGPDDHGVWWDEQSRIGLAHRRLSIIDLTSAGHQPMSSGSERFTIVFNGEVYNSQELRRQIDARSPVAWRGRSDTEVILEAIEAWGLVDATRRLNGMFAVAVWDRQERALHLVRDSVGKKPLYYGWIGQVFAFGSELKALAQISPSALEISRDALAAFLRLGHVPGSQCIHPNLRKLRAGQIATIAAHAPAGSEPRLSSFWSTADSMRECAAQPLALSEEALVDQLHAQLDCAVRRRLISDVPVGAFLSGGVDSALVVASMARVSGTRVKTFTIGFDSPAYDESARARATANAIGTEHTEVIATERDAMAIIPRLCEIYDEPFADSSQIPTVMLSELTRASVSVALSGDGADELFGGYDRYRIAPRVFQAMRWAPLPARKLLASALSLLAGRGSAFLDTAGVTRLHEKLARVASILAHPDFESAYRRLGSTADGIESLVIGGSERSESPSCAWPSHSQSIAAQMMVRDFTSYLVDDLLVKVDRASMSVGLEVRSPFLDREMVDWAWRLPMSAKIRGGHGKWISYQLADRLVPGGFPRAAKTGFGVPIAIWLRGELRDWAEDLLDARRLAREGYLDPTQTRRRWDGFLAGRSADRHLIWALLMFQSWNAAQSGRSILQR